MKTSLLRTIPIILACSGAVAIISTDLHGAENEPPNGVETELARRGLKTATLRSGGGCVDSIELRTEEPKENEPGPGEITQAQRPQQFGTFTLVARYTPKYRASRGQTVWTLLQDYFKSQDRSRTLAKVKKIFQSLVEDARYCSATDRQRDRAAAAALGHDAAPVAVTEPEAEILR